MAELTTVAELIDNIVGVLFPFSLDRLDEYSFCFAFCLLHLFIFVFVHRVCFFWWQLGLDDGSAVDKQVLLNWTGSTRSGQVSAASPDRTGFARTERVQVRRTKQVADFASWENVAAAAAVADFPSLVLLEAAAGQASHITSYAHRSARHGAPVPALHMPRHVPARPPPPPPPLG